MRGRGCESCHDKRVPNEIRSETLVGLGRPQEERSVDRDDRDTPWGFEGEARVFETYGVTESGIVSAKKASRCRETKGRRRTR